MDGLVDLEEMVITNQDNYERGCFGCAPNSDCPEGAGSLDPVINSLSLLEDAFLKIIEITVTLSSIIECERVNSIYVDLIHVGACEDIPYALTWMFAMLLIFSSLGLLIITFRAAMLPPKKASDYHDFHKGDQIQQNDETRLPPHKAETGTERSEPEKKDIY